MSDAAVVDSSAQGGASTEFSREVVPAEARRGFASVFSVWVNFQLSTVMLFFGGVTLAHLTLPEAILVVAVATSIIASVSFATGYLGAKTGLSTALLCERLFGVRGGLIQQIFQSAIELGWFVVIVGLTGEAASTLLGATNPFQHAALTLAAGFLYVLSVCFGFRGLRILGMIAAPVVLVLLAILCARHFSEVPPPYWRPVHRDLNLFQSISLATGTFITGAALSADLARFARTPRIGGAAGCLAFLLTIPLQLLLGALVAMTNQGSPDFLQAVSASDLGTVALVFLVMANCVGDATLYLAVVPLGRLIRTSRLVLVVVLGTVGSCLAAFGVSDVIVGWLQVLSILLPPLAGPLIWAMVCLMRGEEIPAASPGLHRGLLAWVLGAVTAAAMEGAGVGLAPVGGLAVSLLTSWAPRRR